MLYEKIKEILSEQLGLAEDEIKMDSSFIEDLGADSLDLVEFVMTMEAEFDMEVDEDDFEGITTVADAINYIKEHTDLD